MNALEVSQRLDEIAKAIVQINRALDSIRLDPAHVQAALNVLEAERERLTDEEEKLRKALEKVRVQVDGEGD